MEMWVIRCVIARPSGVFTSVCAASHIWDARGQGRSRIRRVPHLYGFNQVYRWSSVCDAHSSAYNQEQIWFNGWRWVARASKMRIVGEGHIAHGVGPAIIRRYIDRREIARKLVLILMGFESGMLSMACPWQIWVFFVSDEGDINGWFSSFSR